MLRVSLGQTEYSLHDRSFAWQPPLDRGQLPEIVSQHPPDAGHHAQLEGAAELVDQFRPPGDDRAVEFERLQTAATRAFDLGLEVHAGHGLDYDSVGPVAAIPQIAELNIGHFIIGEAIFTGLAPAIQRMRALMDEARA